MTNYLNINKKAWNERTNIHFSSKFYNVEGFLEGHSSLHQIELAQVGDVSGKSMLHLQCHFGLDTLSWSRLGAIVTGVDLSSSAIEKARLLAKQAKLSATFINSDVYEYGQQNNKQFDLVFTSYGVLCWLPCMKTWAETIAKSLKLGGKVHLVEFHPYLDVKFGYDYFHNDVPDIEEESTYSENAGEAKQTIAVWAHPISDVVNALISAGIEINELHEFPYSPYPCFDNMKKLAENQFVLDEKGPAFPLIYSLVGTKV